MKTKFNFINYKEFCKIMEYSPCNLDNLELFRLDLELFEFNESFKCYA